ncbi:MAG: hypothetical protein H6729_07725 [Deltaproteobacteria bacterium]|nr:hypothetical protein [Deltaproteobacteria bacterium]
MSIKMNHREGEVACAFQGRQRLGSKGSKSSSLFGGRNAVASVGLVVGVGLMAGTMGLGCGTRAEDINTVQPGYVRKSIFQQDSEWYYRRTIVKSETQNAYIIEGHGDIPLDRVKFEITEDHLLAYKPYESLPGSDRQTLPGGGDFYKGVLLAAWPIESHFDIIRGYDPLTGRETNQISPNDVDRPWRDREYMVVDWSTNEIEDFIYADQSGYWFPIKFVSTSQYWTDAETSPTDPYASRFSDDYVEITNHALLGMDLYTCAAFGGYSLAYYDRCGFGEAKVRYSFVRVKEPSDYVPREYPDSVVIKDADGNPTYDEATGEVMREPIYDRFGVFRVQVPTYDRGYGYTESGRLFRAMAFNLWENSKDATGHVLDYAARTPKPIVYYLNTEFPERYRQVASEVANEYNGIFKPMVADLMGKAVADVPDMFVIKDNDCSEANIIQFVGGDETLLSAVQRVVCAGADGIDASCSVTPANIGEHIGLGNLENVCASLYSATLNTATGVAGFDWQRIGDSRYNMIVWLANPQQSGWGGYGPMHADSITGETISATTFLRGFSYEVAAANVVDYIEFMNDEVTTEDVIYGQSVRKQAAATLEAARKMSNLKVGEGYLTEMKRRMGALGSSRSELLVESPNANQQLDRLARIKDTRVEEKLLAEADAPVFLNAYQVAMTAHGKPNQPYPSTIPSSIDVMMASDGTWHPGQEMPEALKRAASPATRFAPDANYSAAAERARVALGNAGFCFLSHDFDPQWAGVALALRDLPRADRYRIVSERLIKHVMLHELGHNVGLSHNFEGTYDATNYNPYFWKWYAPSEARPGDDDPAAQLAYDKQLARRDEYKHTTVMEYLSSKGAFADFLGKYDEAALRFVYANQVAVFNDPAVGDAFRGGQTFRRWRYRHDYSRIPDYVCGGPDGSCVAEGNRDAAQVRRDVLENRSWVTFDPQDPPPNEVPFLFCDNYYDRRTPFCATFDYGANQREIFANYYSNWADYFFFNNFVRDRLSPLAWSPDRALSALNYLMRHVDITTQYLYYLSATNPVDEFGEPFAPIGNDPKSSDLYADMQATVGLGLNFAAEVTATPEPIRMCRINDLGDPLYMPWYIYQSVYDTGCEQYEDLSSAQAIADGAIQIPLGTARPIGIGFTPDYEEWDWSFVGSFFDKQNMMYMLGLSRPTLFRFNYDLDIRNYHIGLYRLYEPELRHFFDRLMNLELFLIDPGITTDFGSYWCADPSAPDVASKGHLEPRRLIDLDSGDSVPGPSADCLDPVAIMPRFVSNTPLTANYVAHALFSSDNDTQLDMGKQAKVYVLGADDDFQDWSAYPSCTTARSGPCYCEVRDSLTGLTYRSLDPNNGLHDASVRSAGCRLIEQAKDAAAKYAAPFPPSYARDRWRSWFERLEFARDLYRIYNDR